MKSKLHFSTISGAVFIFLFVITNIIIFWAAERNLVKLTLFLTTALVCNMICLFAFAIFADVKLWLRICIGAFVLLYAFVLVIGFWRFLYGDGPEPNG